jgi:hypothetical protein
MSLSLSSFGSRRAMAGARGRSHHGKGSLLSKGNREVRKPKTIKPKVIAAAPAMTAQTLSVRKK